MVDGSFKFTAALVCSTTQLLFGSPSGKPAATKLSQEALVAGLERALANPRMRALELP